MSTLVQVQSLEVNKLVEELAREREAYLAFLRARVRSGADAEDLFQQGLVRATKYGRAVEEPRPWFFGVLRRILADHHAQWALREKKLEILKADVEEGTPEELAICGCSLGQLEKINPDYADILRRVDVEEQPLQEVADALGITVNNATVRLHRARKTLREHLLAFCGVDSMRACLDCGCDS